MEVTAGSTVVCSTYNPNPIKVPPGVNGALSLSGPIILDMEEVPAKVVVTENLPALHAPVDVLKPGKILLACPVMADMVRTTMDKEFDKVHKNKIATKAADQTNLEVTNTTHMAIPNFVSDHATKAEKSCPDDTNCIHGEESSHGGKGTNALAPSLRSGKESAVSGPKVGPMGEKSEETSEVDGTCIRPTKSKEGNIRTNAKACLEIESDTNVGGLLASENEAVVSTDTTEMSGGGDASASVGSALGIPLVDTHEKTSLTILKKGAEVAADVIGDPSPNASKHKLPPTKLNNPESGDSPGAMARNE